MNAHVQLWVSQFEGARHVKKEEVEVSGSKVVLVTITGTSATRPLSPDPP